VLATRGSVLWVLSTHAHCCVDLPRTVYRDVQARLVPKVRGWIGQNDITARRTTDGDISPLLNSLGSRKKRASTRL